MTTVFELFCETSELEDIFSEEFGEDFTADMITPDKMKSVVNDYDMDLWEKNAFKLQYIGAYSAGDIADRWHEAYKRACEGCPYFTIHAASPDTDYAIIFNEAEWSYIEDNAHKIFHSDEEEK